MITSEIASSGDNGNRSIYIAKNNGLDEKDQDLIKDLSVWLKGDSPYLHRDQREPEDPVWVKILKFWMNRNRYYVDELSNLLGKLGEVNKFLDIWNSHPRDHPMTLGREERTLGSAAELKINHEPMDFEQLSELDRGAKGRLTEWWGSALELAKRVTTTCREIDLFSTSKEPEKSLQCVRVIFNILRDCYVFRSLRNEQLDASPCSTSGCQKLPNSPSDT